MNCKKIVLKISALLLLLVLVSACATTKQARSAKPSGFLGDYSQLKEGDGDQALLRYVKKNVQWKLYNKILLQPVSIYAGKKSDLGETSREDRKALVDYFTAVLREELSKDYILVSQPGTGVLRIRIALTDADSSEPVLDTITSIVPFGLALSTLKQIATGSGSFVGSAQAEMEIEDSLTDERLVAAVDKRYGTKALRSKFGGWNDAKEAFDYWAEQIRESLEEARKGKN